MRDIVVLFCSHSKKQIGAPSGTAVKNLPASAGGPWRDGWQPAALLPCARPLPARARAAELRCCDPLGFHGGLSAGTS